MRTFYLCLVLLLSCLPAWSETGTSAEPAAPLSLQQAIGLALNANPEIAVALREQEAVAGMQLQAAARPNPVASMRIEDLRSNTRESTLEVAQPIELGGKRSARIQAADSNYDAATAALAAKKAEIEADVAAAYYEVLAAQERLKLAESSLQVAQRASDAASKRVQAGKVSPVEETRSKIAESAVRIELTRAKSALTIARKRLAGLWGNAYPQFSEAEGTVQLPENLPTLQTLDQQLDKSPTMQRARLEVNTRNRLVEVEKTRATPDISVTVGAKRNEELGLNQAVLGLSVPIPLFDRNQGNIQEAMSRTDKARAEMEALRLQLETTLAGAHERLLTARQSADDYQTQILPGAQSAFDAATRGFEFGKFSFLEVLDAQRTLVQAKTQHLDALLEAHRALADIRRILGDAFTLEATPQEP